MTLAHIASAIALLVLSAATPLAAKEVGSAAFPAAARQVSIEDPGHPAIPVVIWAPATGTALPLVVISHGTGASPLSHIDTAQALVDAGFVVVAPMHPGDNFQDDSAVGKPTWFVDRSRHLSKVIDYMLTTWEGRSRLAPGRIGVFGFSAGGTTALISVGGIPDLRRIATHCAATPEFVCRIMGSQTDGVKPQWAYDPRIAAAVIAAPGIGFAFEAGGLANVHVPIQLWSGTADETVPYATNAAIVRRDLPKAPDFHSADGAVHLSFLAPCTPQSPPLLCQDKPGFDRAAFHQTFNRSVVAFFQQKLAAAQVVLPGDSEKLAA